MLQAMIIGHLGADAEVKSANGQEFTTMRIAHSSKWRSQDGQEHEETIWCDATMNGRPAVVEYLKRGQQVCVIGNVSLRVYSSPKDKCMKAGLTISVRNIELIGSKADEVPTQLINCETGGVYSVKKYYHVEELVRDKKAEEIVKVVSSSGKEFGVDRQGWVTALIQQAQ